MIDKKPILQIRNIKSQKVKDKDISGVAGVFISFSNPNDEILLKLISKNKTIVIKVCVENFVNFKDRIDTILNADNQRKQSLCSINQYRKSRETSGFQSISMTYSTGSEYDNRYETPIDIKEDEGIYMSMNNPNQTKEDDGIYMSMNNPNQTPLLFPRQDLENVNKQPLPIPKPRRSVDLGKDYKLRYESIFVENYPETIYNSKTPPLLGGFERLETSPIPKQYNNINFNHFFCMKIREEISHEGGVKLEIDEMNINSISIKEINKELWISKISNSKIEENLHIGDRIITVNGSNVTDKFSYQQQIKGHKINTLIIQRLPKAKVFAIDANKFDAKQMIDFSIKKKCFYLMRPENKKEKWLITEINQRNIINIPSNSINFKEESITLVVQPYEFINSLIA